MQPWVCYWNGWFVPEDEVRISPGDRGFVLGDAAYEVTRTYRHIPFHLDWHLDRLFATLGYLRLDPGLSRERLEALTLEVLERNRAHLGPDDDVTLTHRITRGPSGSPFGGPPPGPPTVLVTCRMVQFEAFARLYDEGIELQTPGVRLPAAGGPDPRAKTQSRLLFALGEVEVKRPDRVVLPLFLDTNGHVTETAYTNVFFVAGGQLVVPPDDVALEGITRRVVIALAAAQGLDVVRRPVTLADTEACEEAFVTSTSPGILPACRLNGRALAPVPGPFTHRLIAAFSAHVGMDVVGQGRAHARR
ncbi:MAG: aminotransferase class IV [Armatimonadota bacterium]|nr:aminotransferase class IV [Armatimonadota bacterium]MDR7457099.1 aminotransferase class IV [Armatimonadota bacterium]MDR7496607.1 aminotransferase class IV [Armatimonadota bacterium]MDR7510629.1 aminotransferase class IV [Armatimonadota bacterium]